MLLATILTHRPARFLLISLTQGMTNSLAWSSPLATSLTASQDSVLCPTNCLRLAITGICVSVNCFDERVAAKQVVVSSVPADTPKSENSL